MSRIDFLGAIICAFPFSLADIKQGSLFKFKFCRCTTFVKQTKHTHFFLVLFSKQTVSFLLKFQWTIDWNCKHMRARLELVNIADIDHWKANKRSYWSGHLNGSNCSEWLNVARINKHIACLFTCLVHHWDDWTQRNRTMVCNESIHKGTLIWQFVSSIQSLPLLFNDQARWARFILN